MMRTPPSIVTRGAARGPAGRARRGPRAAGAGAAARPRAERAIGQPALDDGISAIRHLVAHAVDA